MRIVHIEAGRHLYGGATQVRHLVAGLTKAGVDNVVLCASGSELAAVELGAPVLTVPMHGDLDPWLAPRLVRALRQIEPDLVHVHSRRGVDIAGGWAARWLNIPAVLSRRVDSVERSWFATLKYPAYDRVIALSAAIEAQLIGAGVEANRIVRIPSAVETGRLVPVSTGRERLRSLFSWSPDTLVIGVVAQLIARKRHAWLLPALAGLLARWPRLRVVFFGRGPLERSLRAEVRGAGLEGAIVFAGFRTDLQELLPGLDLLAHPAEREGLGVALLEAASAAVPVVACAVGGVRDVVVDGGTGLLTGVDDVAGFGSAIERLLSSPPLRAQLGANARRRAERHYSVARLVAAHDSLYEQVLAERAPTANVRAL